VYHAHLCDGKQNGRITDSVSSTEAAVKKQRSWKIWMGKPATHELHRKFTRHVTDEW
jgi:hypothetical protein